MPDENIVLPSLNREQLLDEYWKDLSIASKNVRAAMDVIVWIKNNPGKKVPRSLGKIFRVTRNGSLRLRNTLVTTKDPTTTKDEDLVMDNLLAQHRLGWVQDWIEISANSKFIKYYADRIKQKHQ